MGKFVQSARAQSDLLKIWTFIARDNPEAATDVLQAAYQTFELLSQNPGLGQVRPRNLGLRAFPLSRFRNYIVWYRVTGDTVEVVRVLHAARDFRKAFDQ